MRLPARAAALAALLSAVIIAVPGVAAAAPVSRTGEHPPGGANPWLHRRFLNMAHAGGENEAPGDTMYAFKRAVRHGADMIELDVQSTADDRLVVMHNATLDPTTDGAGLVRDHTYRQVHALDAAYYFVPGRSAVPGLPPSSYPLRGIRTRQRRPPRGYRADDFAIPSLSEVLRTFRHVPVNIEIKGTTDADTASFLHNARLLAALLNRAGRTDVIVTSFNDQAVAEFHRLAPRIPLAPGLNGVTAYVLTGVRPIDGTVALQVPVRFDGVDVATKAFIARAHADGYAVHVWFSGTAPENAATYNQLIDACADGLMAAWPTLLERILDRRHIARPGRPGTDPCRS
ncbi:MAG TPA: glycerophosphodiester phosphodiesterase family protein [Streptosporangiaceae bacterium]|jgi:glycerophosphoryl diester phosphodiesterase